MSRRLDLSHLERQALRAEEQAAKARAEEAAVIVGVMETVALQEARGAAFIEPTVKRGEKRQKPYRRLSGLLWLHSKGRITDAQLAAGEVYGGLYRAAQADPSIRSNLNQSSGGSSDRIATINRQIRDATRRLNAGGRLDEMRAQVGHSTGLVDALDAVAGRELTPREASRNGAEAAALEALVIVALDLLAKAEGE